MIFPTFGPERCEQLAHFPSFTETFGEDLPRARLWPLGPGERRPWKKGGGFKQEETSELSGSERRGRGFWFSLLLLFQTEM